MNVNRNLLIIVLCLNSLLAFAQREKGGFFKNLTIKPKNNAAKDEKKDKKRDEFEDFIEETIELKMNTQFEPKKELSPVVSTQDTTTVDEGELNTVELEEEIEVNGDWVKVASYYSIWDSRVIDPYNIDPNDFDDIVDIQLYDPSKNQYFSPPLNTGKVTSIFGMRWGRRHTGVDLDLDTGEPVYSTFDGIVRISAFDGRGYGRFVVVRHYNGLETLYGHLSKEFVSSGTIVKAGDQIGLGGSTGRSSGSHLHFETRYEGNPFSPQNIFNFAANNIKSDHFLLTKNTFGSFSPDAENEYASGAKVRTRITAWHRIRRGDTLQALANRFGMTAERLAKFNGISTRSSLRPGKRLRVR